MADSDMRNQAQHPRAFALRVGFILLTAFFLSAAILIGVLEKNLLAGAFAAALFASSLQVAPLLMNDPALLPRNRPLEPWERRTLSYGAFGTLGLGITLFMLELTVDAVPRALALAALVAPCCFALFALTILLRP